MRSFIGGLAARADVTIIRFAVVGVITTVLDLVLFSSLVTATGQPIVSNVVSYSCGLAVSYLLNRSWTFRVEGDLRQALKFFALISTGMLISTALVALLTTVLPPIAAKLTSVPVVFVWNYLTSRFLVFNAANVSNGGSGQPFS